MSKRGRLLTYGPAAAMVLGGVVCAAVISGVAGQVLALVLIGGGLAFLMALVFMEVGLTEDHARAEEATRRRRPPRPPPAPPRPRLEPIRVPRLRGPRHER